MKSCPQEKTEVLSIAQAKALPDGAIVPAVDGQLRCFGLIEKRFRPDGTAYTSQSFTLWDGKDEIDGTAYDQNDLAYWPPMMWLVFSSKKSRNGRYGGVTVHVDMAGHSVFRKQRLSAALRVSKAAVIRSSGTVNAQ
jgi:hypothetical protein